MTTSLAILPSLLLIGGGLVLPLLRGPLRAAAVLVLPLAALGLVWQVPDGVALAVPFLGYELALVKGDALSRLFATVFSLMAFAGGLFALNQRRTVELSAAFCYAGAAIGVVFAGDLVTVFIFWELMAIASTVVIWSAGPSARAAGLRYAAIHLFGGILLMAGIAGQIADTGSLAFGRMTLDSVPRWLILAGFLVNVAAPPFSSWLPDAYVESSWSGMVFLSAFTTKTAVYVLLRGYPGTELLIYLGLFMVFYGIVYAILENDMRRILAYSIVNQVGFMVTGVGIGTEMALNGAAAHAFAHIIYKALLLMSAGSVLYMTGKRKCTDLGGLFRTMPITAALRHRRRPVDLGVSVDVRLRLQVHDLGGRRHGAPRGRSGTCSPRPRPASSCMPASSSPGSSSSRRIPACVPPTRRGTCAPPCCCSPPFASGWALHPDRFTRCCRSRSTSCPTPDRTSSFNCSSCFSPASRSSSCWAGCNAR